MPACEAIRATTSLSRSTAMAPVSRHARLFSSSVAKIASAPKTAPSMAPIFRATDATCAWNGAATVQRLPADTTSVEITMSPGRKCGASAPAIPKLIRQLARLAAFSTRTAVRSRSPAPITTGKPAARAILASAASPEVQSTVDRRCICTLPRRWNWLFSPADTRIGPPEADPRLSVDVVNIKSKRHVIAVAQHCNRHTLSRAAACGARGNGRGPHILAERSALNPESNLSRVAA